MKAWNNWLKKLEQIKDDETKIPVKIDKHNQKSVDKSIIIDDEIREIDKNNKIQLECGVKHCHIKMQVIKKLIN